ncbi:hypothetical protein E0198_002897 [Clavispora lusitaniae]|nr:hypothetical protein E0198_002897 [Clavispora lusitaniae]
MSPPTPVLSRAEVFARILKNSYDPLNTTARSADFPKRAVIRFQVFSPDSSTVQETICIPFKRLFQRCLVPYAKKVNGKKETASRWVNIEITDAETNEPVRAKYGEEVKRFLEAEQDLVRWMDATMRKQD